MPKLFRSAPMGSPSNMSMQVSGIVSDSQRMLLNITLAMQSVMIHKQMMIGFETCPNMLSSKWTPSWIPSADDILVPVIAGPMIEHARNITKASLTFIIFFSNNSVENFQFNSFKPYHNSISLEGLNWINWLSFFFFFTPTFSFSFCWKHCKRWRQIDHQMMKSFYDVKFMAHPTIFFKTILLIDLGIAISLYLGRLRQVSWHQDWTKFGNALLCRIEGKEVSSSLSKFVQVCPSLSKFVQVFPSFSKFVQGKQLRNGIDSFNF